MHHGAASEWGRDNAAGYKSRVGIRLFLIYCAFYAGFVIINSVWPRAMGWRIWGLNLAIVYGFGLIGLALVLAIVYGTLCSRTEERLNQQAKDLAVWFDEMHEEGRLPPGWTKEKVIAFGEALISLETEISFKEGENLSAMEAFQSLFEDSEPNGMNGTQGVPATRPYGLGGKEAGA